MPIISKKNGKLTLVCIYDPLPLEKVWIDKIREGRVFDTISVLEGNAILFAKKDANIEGSLQLIRLEYNDSNVDDFHERNLDVYEKLLQHLPSLRIRALGVNLSYRIVRDENKSAGEFIRDKFLNDRDALQKMLGSAIFGSSTRIFYGEPRDYFDVRITPADFVGSDISVTLHKHKDVDIADQEVLIKTTKNLMMESCSEGIKVLNNML